MQSDPLADLGRPPGRLVDIGGFRLHVWSQGTGRPPVVPEAGTWEVALAWAWILPEGAKVTQAVGYDRAGLGWGEPSGRPCPAEVMVQELRQAPERTRQAVQGEFARMSPHGKVAIAPEGGRAIQLEHPNPVIAAIKEVVAAIQTA